jgi:hypothetical protein
MNAFSGEQLWFVSDVAAKDRVDRDLKWFTASEEATYG